jgi:uncharacterized membrane protein
MSLSKPGYEGPVAPVIGSILGVVAWLAFILVYALYWSNGFSLFQNVIVTIVSLLIAGLVIGLIWLVFFDFSGRRRTRHSGDLAQLSPSEQ